MIIISRKSAKELLEGVLEVTTDGDIRTRAQELLNRNEFETEEVSQQIKDLVEETLDAQT